MYYVVGFMFSQTLDRVALIRKQKPAWQSGKLNGIGGKVEPAEAPSWAMAREFQEEAGYRTQPGSWRYFARMSGKANNDGGEFIVYFFAAIGDVDSLQSVEDEQIEIVPVARVHPLNHDLIDNLAWPVGLAIDHLQDGCPQFAVITYP